MGRLFFLFVILFQITLSHAGDKNDFYSQTNDPQKFYVLNRGPEAFNLRIKLIREARKYIHIESYLFSDDMVGRLLLQELVQKAKEGVEVRIIVDSLTSKKFITAEYAYVLKQNNIEVKYYNDTFLINPKNNHRDHRKLFIVDGESLIMGGRNLSSAYFELDPGYNFYDRDVLVEGSMAENVNKSFVAMWEAKIVQSSKDKKLNKKKVEYLRALLGQSQFNFTNEVNLSDSYTCLNTEFISEFPYGEFDHKTRILKYNIFNKIQKSTVVMETPYLIIDKEMKKYFNKKNFKLEFKIVTNSLISNDQVIAYNGFIDSIKEWIAKGISVFTLSGNKIYSSFNSKNIYGTHAKTFVFNDQEMMIGSFNMDPRSENINVESMISCKDSPELALAVKSDILKRSEDATLLTSRRTVEKLLREGVSFYKTLLSDLTRIPALLIKNLL